MWNLKTFPKGYYIMDLKKKLLSQSQFKVSMSILYQDLAFFVIFDFLSSPNLSFSPFVALHPKNVLILQ